MAPQGPLRVGHGERVELGVQEREDRDSRVMVDRGG